MRKFILGIAAAATLLGASIAAGGAAAEAQPQLIFGVDRAVDQPKLDRVQYYWGGHRYCWYSGWNGAGYYWCGYGWRRGYGWGGGEGWHHWRYHYMWRDHMGRLHHRNYNYYHHY